MSHASSSSDRSRPTPDRTLRQPHRLNVSDRDAPSISNNTDIHDLRASYTRKAELQRIAERWADRMMEDTLDRQTFKRATGHISAQQYREVLHERQLNSLCSYPLCSSTPARVYSASRRLVISSTKRTIREKEGNEEDGFCSKRCMTRSGWVEKALGEEAVWLRGEKGELELLEEIEERRASGSALDRRAVREDSPITEPTALQVEARRPTPISTSETAAGTLPFSSRPASSVSTQPPKQVSDAMDNLIIHERDTPATVPDPPSVSTPSMTTQLAAKLPSPLPATTRRDVPSQVYSAFGVPDPTRPAPSSLLAPTSLTTTLLSASRQMGPIPQLSPDSDDEGDAERRRGWEKAMGWGEVDEERRALFDEAMLAREIMQDEEVDGGGYR